MSPDADNLAIISFPVVPFYFATQIDQADPPDPIQQLPLPYPPDPVLDLPARSANQPLDPLRWIEIEAREFLDLLGRHRADPILVFADLRE
jgi:hypothetical protein